MIKPYVTDQSYIPRMGFEAALETLTPHVAAPIPTLLTDFHTTLKHTWEKVKVIQTSHKYLLDPSAMDDGSRSGLFG